MGRREYLIAGGVLVFAIVVLIIGLYQSHRRSCASIPHSGEKIWSREVLRAAEQRLSADTFYPGISVGGLDLSGLSPDEARQVVTARADMLADSFQLRIVANKDHFLMSADEAGFSYDVNRALEKAWRIGRNAVPEGEAEACDIMARLALLDEIEKQPVDVPLEGRIYRPKFEQTLRRKLAGRLPVFRETRAVSFDTDTKEFVFEEGMTGLEADYNSATRDLLSQIDAGETSCQVTLHLMEKKPERTAAEIREATGFIAEASTVNWDYWDSPRKINLRLAADILSGTVVQPGEVFSYVDALSPISAERGFKPAGTIIGGLIVDDIGGGLCQPSTTLFQAAVKADLEIVERHNHGMVGDYYLNGQDAMIYGGSFDFRFKNNTDYPIGIEAEVTESAVIYRLYGRPLPEGVTIDLYSEKVKDLEPEEEVEERENPDLKPGETKVLRRPFVGSAWKTYRIYYKDGVEIDREYLTYSEYPSLSKIIEVRETGLTETVTTTPPASTKPKTTKPAPPPPTTPPPPPPTTAPEVTEPIATGES